jgi:hypothetical protein
MAPNVPREERSIKSPLPSNNMCDNGTIKQRTVSSALASVSGRLCRTRQPPRHHITNHAKDRPVQRSFLCKHLQTNDVQPRRWLVSQEGCVKLDNSRAITSPTMQRSRVPNVNTTIALALLSAYAPAAPTDSASTGGFADCQQVAGGFATPAYFQR